MKKIKHLVLLVLLLVPASTAATEGNESAGQEAITRRALGAVGDGQTDDRAAIEAGQADAAEELRLDEFFQGRSWVDTLAFPIMAAIQSHTLHRMPALNLLNRGTIRNLPDDVFVETPAIVDASGIRPVAIGDLPAPLAAFNRRDIDQMELTVEAAVTGDRKRVLQAMMLDPVVDSVSAAEKVIDEMFRVQAEHLPQFQ